MAFNTELRTTTIDDDLVHHTETEVYLSEEDKKIARTINQIVDGGFATFLSFAITEPEQSTQRVMAILAGLIHGANTAKIDAQIWANEDIPPRWKMVLWTGLRTSNVLLQTTLLEITQLVSNYGLIEAMAQFNSVQFPDTFIGNTLAIMLMAKRVAALISFLVFIGPTIYKTGVATYKTVEATYLKATDLAEKIDRMLTGVSAFVQRKSHD